jgi:predicted nucleic acid-binding Zn finger protein
LKVARPIVRLPSVNTGLLVGIHMQTAYEIENKLMEEACAELKSRRELSDQLKDALTKTFGGRFTNGWNLANSKKVRKYEFMPSGRLVWAVQGRKGEYQVMPDIPFCYCDDYYFRVMDKKRGLCYHIIAQRVAEALNQFATITKKDSQYSIVTDRWRAKEKTETPE